MPVTDNRTAQLLRFKDANAVQEYADSIGAKFHPRVSIAQSPAGGTGLFFNAGGFTSLDTEREKGLVELFRLSPRHAISMPSFEDAMDQISKAEQRTFNKYSRQIAEVNSNVIEDPYLKFPVPKCKLLSGSILSTFIMAMGYNESNVVKGILVSLVVLKNYCQYLHTTYQNIPEKDKKDYQFLRELSLVCFLEAFSHQVDSFLKMDISTFDVIMDLPDGVSPDDDDSDEKDLLYQIYDKYRDFRPILARLEYILQQRYSDLIYDAIQLTLSDAIADKSFQVDIDDIKEILLPLKELHQCEAVVLSRALEIPRPLNDDEKKQIQTGEPQPSFTTDTSLVPFLDFANHSNAKLYKNAYFDSDPESGDILLLLDYDETQLSQQVKLNNGDPNVEVFISYNPQDDLPEFIRDYGFLPLHKNCRGSDYNAWEISLDQITPESHPQLFNPEDTPTASSKLLHNQFARLCKLFNFLPTFQLVFKLSDTVDNDGDGLPAIDPVNINLCEISDTDFENYDGLLFLFHPDLKNLLLDHSGKLVRNDENSNFLSSVPLALSEGTQKQISDLKAILSHATDKAKAEDLRNQAFRNFKQFLTATYIPFRLNELAHLTNNIKANYNSFPPLVRDVVNWELKVLKAIDALLRTDKNIEEIFRVDKTRYQDHWRTSRHVPKPFVNEDFDEDYDDDFDDELDDDFAELGLDSGKPDKGEQ